MPRSVKLLMGIGTSLDVIDKLPENTPVFLFEGGLASDTTIMDRFTAGCKKSLLTEHADARTLVLRDLLLFDAIAYRNHPNSGPLFIEDMTASVRMEYPGQMWARQLNIESMGNPKVFNNGGTMWVLGWKSETGETLAENRNGGRMEMWAGLPYTFGVPKDSPAFVNDNSSLAASFAGMTFVGGDNPFFSLLVRDTQGRQARDYRREGAPARGGAVFLPLFVSTTKPSGARDMNLSKIVIPAAIAAVTSNAATVAVTPVATEPAPLAAPAAASRSFKLPDFMDGEKQGSRAGNPNEVGGKPLWRLDQVWPDDILQGANYTPLTWGGQQWVAPDQKFGNANAKIENGNLTLGIRSAWGGSGNEAGSKLDALVFVAPVSGHYTVAGIAHAGVWQGDGVVSLSILKRDGQKITRLKSIPLPKDQDVSLQGVETDLDLGQELLLAPQIGAWYTGANLELKNLKVSSGAAGMPAVSGSDLNPGSIITIGGRRFRVEIVEGKIVVLRQVD